MPRGKYAYKRKAGMRRRGTAPRPSRGFGRKKRFSKYRLAGSGGISRGPSTAVFPQRLFKTFSYSSENIKLAQTTTSIPAGQVFRGNSMYDPDFTSIGSQPRWYDTLVGANDTAAPYNKCTVLASKITINIWQDPTLTGTSGSTAGLVSVIPYAGTSSFASSLKEIQERAFVRYRNVGNANSHSPLVLKSFCKTKALYTGFNPLADASFTSDYNGNPSKQWYWAVQAVNIISGAGVNLFSCYITARIKYYCVLSQLNDVANS